jgi:hypothetical protein
MAHRSTSIFEYAPAKEQASYQGLRSITPEALTDYVRKSTVRTTDMISFDPKSQTVYKIGLEHCEIA